MTIDFGAPDRVSFTLDRDGVAQLRLNRADKLNALDPAMFDALIGAGAALADMPGLRCVVMAGEGRGFCAGLDLASMAGDLAKGVPLTERSHGLANRFQQAALAWRLLPVPVIVAVHGVCLGGGLQIAAGGDVRVIAPDAKLAVMEMKWGIVPDMGGFALWRGCVRDDVLRDLTYTNRSFTGAAALDLGFATMLDADPLARAQAIAREIAQRNPHAVRAAKALFNRAPDLDLAQILIAESEAQARLLGTPNQIEAVASQMAGRAGIFAD